MENRVTAGSPISQNEGNVKSFSRKFRNTMLRLLYHKIRRMSRPFQKKFQMCVFEIIFDYLTMKREAAIFRDELDSKYYRMYVYPRTLKGLSTAEFVKVNRIFKKAYTDLEAIDDFVEEVEAALAEAHLLEYVNTFFENISLDREITVEVINGIFFR